MNGKKKGLIGLVMIGVIIALSGCFFRDSVKAIEAELKEKGKEIPILRIVESEIEVEERDKRIVSYSLQSEGKAPYPETCQHRPKIVRKHRSEMLENTDQKCEVSPEFL